MLVLITLSMDRKLCHGVHQQLNEEDVQMQCSDLDLVLFTHRESSFSSDTDSYIYLGMCCVYLTVYQGPLGDVLFLLHFLPDND